MLYYTCSFCGLRAVGSYIGLTSTNGVNICITCCNERPCRMYWVYNLIGIGNMDTCHVHGDHSVYLSNKSPMFIPLPYCNQSYYMGKYFEDLNTDVDTYIYNKYKDKLNCNIHTFDLYYLLNEKKLNLFTELPVDVQCDISKKCGCLRACLKN